MKKTIRHSPFLQTSASSPFIRCAFLDSSFSHFGQYTVYYNGFARGWTTRLSYALLSSLHFIHSVTTVQTAIAVL